jgi:sugar phosphate isomerase/epimerase
VTAPIAIQLYSLRESLAKDFDGVIRRVAAMGYVGVETAGFDGTTPQAAARLFADLGLKVSSVHSGLPLGDSKNQVLDTMELLGCQSLVCPYFPPDQFTTLDSVKRICDQLNQADEVARANGLTFFYHNHWWEYRERLDGIPVYQVMLQHLNPTIHLEIDTYWVKTGGVEPSAVLRELGPRASLLHIKDGPADENQPMTAVGDGIMDWPPIMSEARSADWLIVEIDRCAADMLEAVSRSYQFLVEKGYARGQSR